MDLKTGMVSWRLLAPGSLTRPGTSCRSEPPWLLRERKLAEAWTSQLPLSHVLVSEEGSSTPASAELLSVSRWAETHLPKECLDILEVSWGEPVLSRAARLKGFGVGPAVVHGGKAY